MLKGEEGGDPEERDIQGWGSVSRRGLVWEGGRLTVGATQRDKERGVRRERERETLQSKASGKKGMGRRRHKRKRIEERSVGERERSRESRVTE